jgi:hypothetical protein
MVKFWGKLFGINFALGFTTGLWYKPQKKGVSKDTPQKEQTRLKKKLP